MVEFENTITDEEIARINAELVKTANFDAELEAEIDSMSIPAEVKQEPKRSIFEDIGTFNFYPEINKVLRFNSYFSKLGFERVNLNKEFGIYTYYPQLTLMINPTMVLKHDSEIDEKDENFILTRQVLQRRDIFGFDLWEKFFSGKKGFNGISSHSIIKRSKEEVKPLKIMFENKELMLGQYLKERNIVILYINPFKTDYSIENNEYLELVLKLFSEQMNEMTLKKVDVSEKMRNAFIEKFKNEINERITNIRDTIRYSENEINNLQSNLIRTIKLAQINRKQIEGLISFSTNTDDTIKKAIEEVKKLPFVSNVRLVSNGIGLDVGSVIINHKGLDVYMGDYYIMINPDGVKVYCKNPVLNNEGVEISHPHIDGNHNCYGGEREQKIIEYLSNFDLKKVVYFVYMFLKTYTPDDSYNDLSLWVREDLKRAKKEIVTDTDILNVQFEGDYFQPRNDNGSDDGFFDDNEESEDEDDYMGECYNCGNNIYENGDDYVRDNNSNLFCCNSCLHDYERDNPN